MDLKSSYRSREGKGVLKGTGIWILWEVKLCVLLKFKKRNFGNSKKVYKKFIDAGIDLLILLF